MKQQSVAIPAFYLETHFAADDPTEVWPADVAIISAYATTGQKWTDAQNAAADRNLEAQLRGKGRWLRRVIGFSPVSGHVEPSWAMPLSLDEACEIGLQFHQDAIYYVREDDLFLSFCDERRQLILIGSFRTRLRVKRQSQRGR